MKGIGEDIILSFLSNKIYNLIKNQQELADILENIMNEFKSFQNERKLFGFLCFLKKKDNLYFGYFFTTKSFAFSYSSSSCVHSKSFIIYNSNYSIFDDSNCFGIFKIY
jgi:isoaspartyl peptidase/L-asparaginase-like protein (Ntn-hydrolase superfamily)